MSDLAAMSDDALKNLRIKKVAWEYFEDTDGESKGFICKLRLTLNDGSTSHLNDCEELSEYAEEFVIPDDRPVRSIRLRHTDYDVYGM